MISFAEFYKNVPSNQAVELHVIEGNEHFDVADFNLDSNDLHFAWHEYGVVSIYAYVDKYNNDEAIIHALITYLGEDSNNDEEE